MSELVQLRARPEDSSPAGLGALLAKGFRPFFLLASLMAVFWIPLWVVVRSGLADVGEHLLPTVWHAHEMVFGFAAAVVGGFLLTAASNWTKRVTATGGFLALLCAVWIAGRVVGLLGGVLPGWLIAAVSLSFIPLLTFAVGRPIFAAGSRRNYGLVLVLVILFAAQLMTHLGALTGEVRWQTSGPRLGVGLVIVIIQVIGGRVIPMFTRNATGAAGIRSIPWLDRASVLTAVLVVVADLLLVRGTVFAVLAALAAVASIARMRAWGTRASLSDSLLWVLHVGYLFVPLGFMLRAVAATWSGLNDSTALHALTAGAIGTLILGMIVRVSLGHTGRPLKTPPVLTIAFVLVAVAALLRVFGTVLATSLSSPLLHRISIDGSSTLFAIAFLAYAVRIGPSLFKPRPDGKPG